MFTINVIGNLGADAKKVVENGAEFISFRVAHSSKFTDKDGNTKEETEWISCTINGNRDNLMQYLTKGAKVFVTGRGQTHIYSSPKFKRMLAGVRCFVDRIELIGGSSEPVPRHLVSPDGELIDVRKFYQIDPEQAKKAGAKNGKNAIFFTERGTQFEVTKDGWVDPREIISEEKEAESQEKQG